jgi:hypothetical protein
MIAIRESVASLPVSTRSYSRVLSTWASAYEVCTASEPARPGSDRCTALSAPMDRALRIVSAARSGPIVRMVTSPAPTDSLMRRASSTAYSSISFITTSTDARSSVLSDSWSRRSAQVSGTCLTSTTMFTWASTSVRCSRAWRERVSLRTRRG